MGKRGDEVASPSGFRLPFPVGFSFLARSTMDKNQSASGSSSCTSYVNQKLTWGGRSR